MAYYLVSFFLFIIFETILFSAFCFVFPSWIRATYVVLALFFLTLFFFIMIPLPLLGFLYASILEKWKRAGDRGMLTQFQLGDWLLVGVEETMNGWAFVYAHRIYW